MFPRERGTSIDRPISVPVVLLSDAYTGRVAANIGSQFCTRSSNTPWKDKRMEVKSRDERGSALQKKLPHSCSMDP